MSFKIENGVLVAYNKEPGVTDIVIPEGVTSIGDNAFYRCSSLTSVVIPEGVTSKLDEAAARRGMTKDELRNSVLADFGFDEAGAKTYALGGGNVTVKLGADLSLSLIDENGNGLKSIPKKNNDEALVKVASKDFGDLKKNVKKVVAQRAVALRTEFAIGKTMSLSQWQSVYMANPVLRQLASLLVWEADGIRFMPDMGKQLRTVDGSEVTLPEGGDICLAHPAELSPHELEAWRSYLTEHHIAQPFTQMFEKVYTVDASSVSDRYNGVKVMYYHAKSLEKEGTVNYSDCAKLYGIRIAMNINSDDNWGGDWSQRTVELGKITVPDGTKQRTLNHVLAITDYMCLDGAARTDKVELLSQNAESITEKNIQKLIDAALSTASPNTTAWLMNYKNENFTETNVWADLEL